MLPDDVTWLAIDNRGKTHHVSAEDVIGANVELLEDVRILHELIVRLRDHPDPEVRGSIIWACRQIGNADKAGDAAPDTSPHTEQRRRPHIAILVSFGTAALIGAITAIDWLFSLVARI